MNPRHLFSALTAGLLIASLSSLTSCTVRSGAHKDDSHLMEVSIPDQKMVLYRDGKAIKTYPVSTSKFGLGDKKGSYKTPLGRFEVAEKIGAGKPLGAVFKSRRWTGEVLKPNAPGRDPIVSRILWLHGLENKNKNAYSRCIYIHGTAAEKDIGKRASYGCVRMKSRDIIEVFDKIGSGTRVNIIDRELVADLDADPVDSSGNLNLVNVDSFKPATKSEGLSLIPFFQDPNRVTNVFDLEPKF